MAEYYDTSIKVIGNEKENVEHFIKLFDPEGFEGRCFYDCTINYDFLTSNNIEIEEKDGKFIAGFMIQCRNSVCSCMIEVDDSEDADIEPCTLEQACIDFNLDVEIWSIHPDYYENEVYYEHYLCKEGEFDIYTDYEMLPNSFSYDPEETEEGQTYQQYLESETWDVAKAACQCIVPEEEWNKAVESKEYTEWELDQDNWEEVFWSVAKQCSAL